jgi:Fuc2NAc and GlcNAc transferase
MTLQALVLVLCLAATYAASWLLTWFALLYARRSRLLDVPNERSSHDLPTPRGGGIGMVLTWLVAMAALAWWELLPLPWITAWAGGGALVAAAGWRDDHRSVHPGLRLLIQVVAASWAVLWLGGLPEINLGPASLKLGAGGTVLAVLGIVWLTNLYNFMDGIDGLAASQAVGTSLAASCLAWAAGAENLAIACLSLGAVSAGFLSWNWPPAKIFMGDVGSGWLGFGFGVLAVAGEHQGAVPLLVWVVLLSAFVWDATYTLLARVARGERWYNAHRNHAYQRAVQGGASHRTVTESVMALNLFCFWPAAWLAARAPDLMPGVLMGTALASVALWWSIRRWETRKRKHRAAVS